MSGNGGPFCAWSEAYRLDLPEIDAQRRELVGIMNRLWRALVLRAGRQESLGLVANLEAYCIAHFCAEETIMRVLGYPELECHKHAHARFAARIAAEKPDILAGAELSLDLLHFLQAWLTEHILIADQHYADFCHEQKRPRRAFGKLFGWLAG